VNHHKRGTTARTTNYVVEWNTDGSIRTIYQSDFKRMTKAFQSEIRWANDRGAVYQVYRNVPFFGVDTVLLPIIR